MSENCMAVVLNRERPVTLGLPDRQADLLDDMNPFCDEGPGESSMYTMLHRLEGLSHREADLFVFDGHFIGHRGVCPVAEQCSDPATPAGLGA